MSNRSQYPNARNNRLHRVALITGMANFIETKSAAERRYGVRLASRALTPANTKLPSSKWLFELSTPAGVSPSKRRQVKAYITGQQEQRGMENGQTA